MNIFGALPSSTSAGKSLNKIDYMNLIRMGLVMLASGFLTIGVPQLTGQSWVFNGVDFTPLVTFASPLVLESIRRFVANNGGSVDGN